MYKLFFRRCINKPSAPAKWGEQGYTREMRKGMRVLGGTRRLRPDEKRVEPPVMPFPMSLDLLQCTHGQPFETMENHINPQSIMCNLHGIKYDYIGHMETLEADVKAITGHLNLPKEAAQAMHSFFATKSVHSTNADARTREMFASQKCASVVEDVYSCDMEIPLNNISFSRPLRV